MNRTKNSARNSIISLLSKVIYIFVTFICRTFFIKYLGAEYLGINGLFTNILTILSLAELGIGNAIIFKLYKPIANNDENQIRKYANFYKSIYFAIGFIIFFLGLCIVPFLKYIVTDTPNVRENITLIYILFLLNSAVSYLFIYKKSIIEGYQNGYIYSIIYTCIMLIQNIVQVLTLAYFRNYIAFLIIQIIGTILTNLITSIIVNIKYPFINIKNTEKINKSEKKEIFNDVKSILLYKIGGVLSNGTDNIIISAALGITPVGLLTNYNTIVNAIKTLINSFLDGFTASVGNLNTIDDPPKKEKIFYQILLLSFLMYGYTSVACAVLINDFITIWVGSKYLFTISIVLALVFDLYVDGMRIVNYTFRNTSGLFKKGKFVPIISSISNVVISILLVKPLGVFGVLIATGITRMFILTMYDPMLLHKYVFKSNCLKYYGRYIYYFFVLIVTYLICKLVHFNIGGIIGFVVNGLITTFITLIVFYLFINRLEEFKELKIRIKNLIFKRR